MSNYKAPSMGAWISAVGELSIWRTDRDGEDVVSIPLDQVRDVLNDVNRVVADYMLARAFDE